MIVVKMLMFNTPLILSRNSLEMQINSEIFYFKCLFTVTVQSRGLSQRVTGSNKFSQRGGRKRMLF